MPGKRLGMAAPSWAGTEGLTAHLRSSLTGRALLIINAIKGVIKSGTFSFCNIQWWRAPPPRLFLFDFDLLFSCLTHFGHPTVSGEPSLGGASPIFPPGWRRRRRPSAGNDPPPHCLPGPPSAGDSEGWEGHSWSWEREGWRGEGRWATPASPVETEGVFTTERGNEYLRKRGIPLSFLHSLHVLPPCSPLLPSVRIRVRALHTAPLSLPPSHTHLLWEIPGDLCGGVQSGEDGAGGDLES